jgi:Na+-driven multidrug efflux pump
MVVIQALNGAGDTRTPSLLNFICFWLVQIPLAYWLATSVGWGPVGVFWAIVAGESLLSILSVMVFRAGKWKLNKV